VIYTVLLSSEAAKQLTRLDQPTLQRMKERLDQLRADPFDARLSAPLIGQEGLRKSRIGGWRILFRVNRDRIEVHILTIARRGQVYQRLS
jgi:mRNA interferase RelE/StbE